MSTLLLQVLLAIALFLLVNWVGRHASPFGYRSLTLFERVEEAQAFNFVFRVATPQVFLILVAAMLSATGMFWLAQDLWRVTALYVVVRIVFNLVMGRHLFINWIPQIITGAIAIGISYWLTTIVLTSPERALPNPGDLTTELWLLVLLFVYQLFNRITFPGSRQAARQDKYIADRFRSFREKFGDIIAEVLPLPSGEALAYAILIYEDFNRPLLYRILEDYALFPLGLARTLGPMQVCVDHRVSAKEGVYLGAKHVADLYPVAEQKVLAQHAKYFQDHPDQVASSWMRVAIAREVAVGYNPDGKYADEVVSLYESILQRFFPAPPDSEER